MPSHFNRDRGPVLLRIIRRFARITYGLVALALLATLVYSVGTPPTPGAPHSLRVHLNHIERTATYTDPYQVSETYGGTNPIDTCSGCDFWGRQQAGTSSPPTTDPSQLVNALTGDAAENYTLFAQPDPGFNFGFSLNYDSLWGQLETFYDALNGNTGPQFYGYGWRSNLSTNVLGTVGTATSNDAAFDVSEPGGGLEQYYTEVNGSCPTTVGGQPITGITPRTGPGSEEGFCAADRVDAEFSAQNNFAEYQLSEHGGLQLMTYDFFGEVTNFGSIENPTAQTVLWRQPPPESGCPSSMVQYNVSVCAAVFDGLGRSYDVGFYGANNIYQAVGVKDPTGQTWVLNVNVGGQGDDLNSVVDPNNHNWQFFYNSGQAAPDQNDLTTIQDPNGNQTQIAYTPDIVNGTQVPNGGFVSSVTDAMNNVTTYSGYSTAAESNPEAYEVTQTNPTGQVINYVLQANEEVEQQETNATGGYAATTLYAYNGTDTNPNEIIDDPMGNSTNISTDEVGNVLKKTVTAQDGHTYGTTTTTYNQYDQPCWSAPPGVSYPSPASCVDWPTIGDGATIYDADQYGNIQEVIDPTGVASETAYDGNGYPCWQSAAGAVAAGAIGGELSCSSPPGDATRDVYNTGGLLQSQSTPDGSGSAYSYDETRYTYNGYGEVLSEVSPNGNVPGANAANYTTTYTYDTAGRLYEVTQPMGRTTRTALDADGNPVQVDDPMGQYTTTAYDQDERPCFTFQGDWFDDCADPPQTATLYSYNANTNDPLTVTDPNGRVTRYTYENPDVPDKATTVTDPLGNITSNVYDLDGNLCVTGVGAASLYAGTGSPSCGPTSGSTYQTFDELGNVLTTTDPSGNLTSYTRGDEAYPTDVTKVIPPSGGSVQPTTYQYDLDGRQQVELEGNGNSVTVAYNAAGEMCWKAPVDEPTANCSTAVPVGGTSWSYYNSQLPSTMRDVISSTVTNTTTWTYGVQGQLLEETNGSGTVGYAYDYAGDNTCVAYPVASGSTCASPASKTNTIVTYGFDADGRMTSMLDWLGHAFSFGYDTRSNLTSITYPSTSTWAEDLGPYDAANNLTELSLTSPTYGTSTTSYPVNANEELAAAGSTTYGYNAQNRVTTAGSQSLGYSPNGELTTNTGGQTSESFNYNQDAELTSGQEASKAYSFNFDGNGNRCGQVQSSTAPSCSKPNFTTTTYGYNAYNEMCFNKKGSSSGASCTKPPSGATTYTYDGDGLRVSEHSTHGTQKFTYDLETRYGQPLIIDDGVNAYLFGPTTFGAGTAPVEQISKSGVVSYLASSPSGVATQFGSTGKVTSTESYDAYGNTKVTKGTKTTPFGFQGSYTDYSGLMYLLNRYYDPATGQFLTVDPDVATTGQPYAAFGDNPINMTDPLGLMLSSGGGIICSYPCSSVTAAQENSGCPPTAPVCGSDPSAPSSVTYDQEVTFLTMCSMDMTYCQELQFLQMCSTHMSYCQSLSSSAGQSSTPSTQMVPVTESSAFPNAPQPSVPRSQLPNPGLIPSSWIHWIENLYSIGSLVWACVSSGGTWGLYWAAAGSAEPGGGTVAGGVSGFVGGCAYGVYQKEVGGTPPTQFEP